MVKQQAGGYSVQVGGDTIVTAFTDGSVPQDPARLTAPDDGGKYRCVTGKNFQANPVEASINAFYIAMPGHKILVDTGSGQLFGPGKGGRLIESLATQGIRPQDITDILITHAHSDHAGGLVKDGQRVFTRAQVYVGQTGYRFSLTTRTRKIWL